MFDTRYYLITICAVFFALATGILIGITYGEDFLIYSQLEVIEQLERELSISRENTALLEKEISVWSGFQDFFWEGVYTDFFKESLAVMLLSDSFKLAGDIVELLEGRGITCSAILFSPGFNPSLIEGQKHLDSNQGGWPDEIIASLTGGDPQYLYGLRDEGKIDIWGDVSGSSRSEWFIILSEKPHGPGFYLEDMALGFQKEERPTIAAFALGSDGALPDSYLEWGDVVIDHLDTFWGRVSLLEVIRTGEKGHFGFKSKQGLFPLKNR